MTEFEQNENVLPQHVCKMTAGPWKTGVKAIGLQMTNLYCPITIVAYFEQFDPLGLTGHSIDPLFQKSFSDGNPNCMQGTTQVCVAEVPFP